MTAEPPPDPAAPAAGTADASADAPERAADDEAAEIDEAILAKVSDFLDGALAAGERAEVARRIADDATWTRAHAELTETRSFLSELRKAHAPSSFAEDVTSTIHQRSAGRLFARRTFGDRVPFAALLVIAIVGLIVIGYVLWSSSTGSLKRDATPPPQPPQGSAVDRP